ncbi:MAG: molybdenum cofactor guanylyltransferase [Trueperaceae bacterium]|nr:molybdenum cofactor guanylyltransferase [Trueperaceae bacterium]
MVRLAGLLLAGGTASRFGSDKALVAVGEETLLDRAAGCLRVACDGPVVVASGDGVARPGVGDRQVADRVAGGGPLSAIAAGLLDLRAGADRVAVLAVDHLAPSPDLLRLLADQPGRWSCALAEVGGRRQPLHAVWSTSIADEVVAAVDDGVRSVLRWLDQRDDVVVVGEEALRDAGIDLGAVDDVDRPEDLPEELQGDLPDEGSGPARPSV